MKRRNPMRIVLVLAVVSFFALAGCAQRQVQTLEGTKVTVKGKVESMQALGGYFVMGEDPPGEYMIVNQDQKLLQNLKTSGKTVIIDGHYTIGADHLFIEKIDGQPYRGKE
jgi:hypothetical protein